MIKQRIIKKIKKSSKGLALETFVLLLLLLTTIHELNNCIPYDHLNEYLAIDYSTKKLRSHESL